MSVWCQIYSMTSLVTRTEKFPRASSLLKSGQIPKLKKRTFCFYFPLLQKLAQIRNVVDRIDSWGGLGGWNIYTCVKYAKSTCFYKTLIRQNMVVTPLNVLLPPPSNYWAGYATVSTSTGDRFNIMFFKVFLLPTQRSSSCKYSTSPIVRRLFKNKKFLYLAEWNNHHKTDVHFISPSHEIFYGNK